MNLKNALIETVYKQIKSAIKFYGKCNYSNYLKKLVK